MLRYTDQGLSGGSMYPIGLFFAVALTGCVNITVGERGKSHVFVGVVRVTMPDRVGAVSAIDVKTLGIGWSQGPFLGWNAGNWVSANPADCQLLIIVKSSAQAEGAAKVLQSLGGQQPCIVDYTHSLRR